MQNPQKHIFVTRIIPFTSQRNIFEMMWCLYFVSGQKNKNYGNEIYSHFFVLAILFLSVSCKKNKVG